MININSMTKIIGKEEGRGEYKICKDNIKKVAYMWFKGLLPPDGMLEFLKNYDLLKKSINVSETTLILDATDLLVLPVSEEEKLVKLYEDYINFKKVYIVNPQTMTQNQLNRIFRKSQITSHFEFVNNINDCKIV